MGVIHKLRTEDNTEHSYTHSYIHTHIRTDFCLFDEDIFARESKNENRSQLREYTYAFASIWTNKNEIFKEKDWDQWQKTKMSIVA